MLFELLGNLKKLSLNSLIYRLRNTTKIPFLSLYILPKLEVNQPQVLSEGRVILVLEYLGQKDRGK